ncbi:MAG TPA: alpha/beta fold hydrolase [Baekduia sp.]
MSRRAVSLDAGGHHIGGIATELQGSDHPLIVALHGGSYTSNYFDVPGHSLLDAATANGIDVVALDRPGYGSSAALPAGEVSFARNAEILDVAIERLWSEHGQRYPGLVVVGHSIGAAITIHLAARRPRWPLLGVALSGIHDLAPDPVRSAWDAMPADQPVVFAPQQRRMFFYGPDWTIEPDIVERAAGSTAPVPLAELLEVVGQWPQTAAALASQVHVPVQYVAFEFEQLWTIDADTVESFAGHFESAPLVACELMTGIGHVADHHRNGRAFQLRQLAFALDCGERMRRAG